MLTGQSDKALELTEECERLIPENAVQSSIKYGKAFILLMQGKYEECLTLSSQILLYTPKATILRLFIIFCNNKLGNTAESESQIKILYKEHPDFAGVKLELPNGVERMVGEREYEITLSPHRAGTDGFYAAAFTRRA